MLRLIGNIGKSTAAAPILSLLVLVFCGSVYAQEAADTVSSLSGVEIETSVDKAEAFIGDLITYTVTIRYDSATELIPPPLGANLGAFDVKDYEPDQLTHLDDGRLQNRTTFVLSTFTTGDYLIPAVPVAFILPDSTRKIMLSEPVPITIKSVLLDSDDSLEIREARSPEVTMPFLESLRDNPLIWYLLGAGLLIVAAVAGWIIRRRRRSREEPVDTRAPWEIAFEDLAHLKLTGYLDEKRYKQYYFELTEILRAFLGRMYLVEFLDMTTEETLDRALNVDLPHGCSERLETTLRHADLVKFAKFLPERMRAESDLELVRGIVEQVRSHFLRQQAAEAAASKTPVVTGGSSR